MFASKRTAILHCCKEDIGAIDVSSWNKLSRLTSTSKKGTKGKCNLSLWNIIRTFACHGRFDYAQRLFNKSAFLTTKARPSYWGLSLKDSKGKTLWLGGLGFIKYQLPSPINFSVIARAVFVFARSNLLHNVGIASPPTCKSGGSQ